MSVGRSSALLMVVTAACRAPAPVVVSAPDAGRASVVQRSVVEPSRQLILKRARCAIPDGGALVSAFDAHRVSPADCGAFPLACSTPAARADVLRALDAGTLTFPVPHHTTRTDALGWFEIALEDDGVLLISCADATIFHAPTGFDRSFVDATVELWPEPELQLEGAALVVDPWMRRVSIIDGGSITLHAWATSLDDPTRIKAPSDATLAAPSGLFGGPPPPEQPLPGGVAVTVRVEPLDGLRRPVRLAWQQRDGGWSRWVDTRTLEHTFTVEPGALTFAALAPGGEAQVRVDVQKPTQLTLALAARRGAAVRVVDGDDRPVSGAAVVADGKPAGTTDAEGFFTLEEPAQRFRAFHSAIGRSEDVSVVDGGVVTLRLAPRSDVELRLEAPDGGAVFGEARIARDVSAAELTRAVSSERVWVRNGVLSLRGLERGRHEVLVLTRDWQAAQLSLEVGDAPLRLTQRLTVKPAIDGVITRAGQPVVDARVRFGRPDAIFGYVEEVTRTDARGRFHLERCLPGESVLRVDAVTTRARYAVPSTSAKINLER